jgi:hypothetical protein
VGRTIHTAMCFSRTVSYSFKRTTGKIIPSNVGYARIQPSMCGPLYLLFSTYKRSPHFSLGVKLGVVIFRNLSAIISRQIIDRRKNISLLKNNCYKPVLYYMLHKLSNCGTKYSADIRKVIGL